LRDKNSKMDLMLEISFSSDGYGVKILMLCVLNLAS